MFKRKSKTNDPIKSSSTSSTTVLDHTNDNTSSSSWGYAPHDPVILSTVDNVPVMKIPNEEGYFPTASPLSSTPTLSSVTPAKLYQMHPKYGCGQCIATGTLTLRDPCAGTPDVVALVGECQGTSFYVKYDDVTRKVSPTEYVLMLPQDCIGVQLHDIPQTQILHFEALLAARTKFRDESEHARSLEKTRRTSQHEALVPETALCKSMYRSSLWVASMIVQGAEVGANTITSYGQSQRNSITETQKKQVSSKMIQNAEKARFVSEKTNQIATKISDSIGNVVGGAVGSATVVKKGDSSSKKNARNLLLASSIAYAEVADGLGEGYTKVVRAAKDETTSYVEKKYGEDAARLARHTAGASVNFGSAALTMRRVVNVKAVAKSSAKKAMKQTIKNSLVP